MSVALSSRLSGLVRRLWAPEPTYVERTGLTYDEFFRTVVNSRRRRVIELVAERGWTKKELAEVIAAEEADGEAEYEDRKAVYVALHQMHLSTLEESGAIEREDGYVVPGPNHAAFTDVLEEAEADG